jgi:hypothetical protein
MVGVVIQGQTSYHTFHKAWPVRAKLGGEPHTRTKLPPSVDFASFMNDMHTTTNQVHHIEFPVSRRPGPTCAKAKPHMPWLASTTTNQAVYSAHDLPMLTLADSSPPVICTPFDADTEYHAEFTCKDPRPFLAHLTGTTTAHHGLACAVVIWCLWPHSLPPRPQKRFLDF